MKTEKARELLLLQIEIGGGYNRNAASVLLAEVDRQYGQSAVDMLIRDLELEKHFEL
ncbi:hypothetical protein [Kaarinaea lacus]